MVDLERGVRQAEALRERSFEPPPGGMAVGIGRDEDVRRKRRETARNRPDVQVVHFDHVALRDERPADRLRVGVPRGTLEEDRGRLSEELSGLDILVNAAGLALGRDFFDASTEDDERTVLETNVNGLIRMTRLCLPHLRDGGYIVNLGSVAGRQAYEKGSLYVTSKFAVRGFTYALREDLLGRPIHITTVDPGLVQTDFSRVRFRGDEEAARRVYEGVEAMKPEDIAECVLFAVTRPPHVNVDELVVKALAQSSGGRILRSET